MGLARAELPVVAKIGGSLIESGSAASILTTLIEAGRGNIGISELPARSGPTAPAKGLFLINVEYPV